MTNGALALGARRRIVFDATFPKGPAKRSDGTLRTARRLFAADFRPHVHEPLRIGGHVFGRGQKRLGRGPDLRLEGSLPDGPGNRHHAREHPLGVAVAHDGALAVAESRDRARRTRSHAWEFGQSRGGFRKDASSLGHLLGRLVQISRAAVVAESRPERLHLVVRRPGEILHRGKGAEKFLKIPLHRRRARLLQHDFGEPSLVRRVVALPRKGVSVASLPIRQRGAEAFRRKFLMFLCHDVAFWHIFRPASPVCTETFSLQWRDIPHSTFITTCVPSLRSAQRFSPA